MDTETLSRAGCLLATTLICGSCASMGIGADVASGRLGATAESRLMIVAHRGASRDAPENTLPAFRLAWQQGADAIEGDFHLTKDGHIVCIHDKNTKKVAGRNLVVGKSTLDELRKLDVGAYRGRDFEGTVIPTIAEVFSTIPEQKKIYIEIKCGAEIIPALIEEIRKSGLKKEQIVVICFNKKVLQKFKALAPQYKVSWLCGVRRDKSGKMRPSLNEVLTILGQINADGFSSNRNAIDEAFVNGVKENGYEHHVWTVDDAETALRFGRWGSASVTTNVPGHMRKYLVEQD
jgi:glycerophosphoryl diester phosphodiesterase